MFKNLFKALKGLWDAFIGLFSSPIKSAEKKIKELKELQAKSNESLGNMKALTISTKRELEKKQQEIKDLTKRAESILRTAQTGKMSQEQADIEAAKVLKEKGIAQKEANHFATLIKNYELQALKAEETVSSIKHQISAQESAIANLKARKQVVDSTKEIQEGLNSISKGSTGDKLRQLKSEITRDENAISASNEAYNDMIGLDDPFAEEDTSSSLLYDPNINSELEMMKKQLSSGTSSSEEIIQQSQNYVKS